MSGSGRAASSPRGFYRHERLVRALTFFHDRLAPFLPPLSLFSPHKVRASREALLSFSRSSLFNGSQLTRCFQVARAGRPLVPRTPFREFYYSKLIDHILFMLFLRSRSRRPSPFAFSFSASHSSASSARVLKFTTPERVRSRWLPLSLSLSLSLIYLPAFFLAFCAPPPAAAFFLDLFCINIYAFEFIAARARCAAAAASSFNSGKVPAACVRSLARSR